MTPQLLKRCLATAFVFGFFLLAPRFALAQMTGFSSSPTANGGQEWSVNLQLLLLLTSMAFLPAILLMMTSFTRIIIVLSLLRTAMGTQAAPPNQVLIGMALFLSLFVMSPVLSQVYADAWQPMTASEIGFDEFLKLAGEPMRTFMLAQTRETDLALFAELAKTGSFQTAADVPFSVLVPSFITSELKTAFQVGFTIFIPFLIIDLVVASVLMALGMMMVPPATISLPFKLMLFVLVDGWQLLIGSLAQSFN
jgi:flagellar biosynthetic protein FliP